MVLLKLARGTRLHGRALKILEERHLLRTHVGDTRINTLCFCFIFRQTIRDWEGWQDAGTSPSSRPFRILDSIESPGRAKMFARG